MSDKKVSYLRFPDSITSCELPGNWLRMARTRERGATMGKIDVYYISPDKIKFRSKVKLEKYFGTSLDLTNFSYQTGKWLTSTSELLAAKKKGRRSKKSVNLAATSESQTTTLSADEPVKLKGNAAEFCKELLPKKMAKPVAAKDLRCRVLGTFVERLKSPLKNDLDQPMSHLINSETPKADTRKSKVDRKTGQKNKGDSGGSSMSTSPKKLPRYSGAKKIRNFARRADEEEKKQKVKEKIEENLISVAENLTHKSVAVQTTDRLQCSPDDVSSVVSLLRLRSDEEDTDNELVIERLINTLKEQLMASSSKHRKEQVSTEQYEFQKQRVEVSKQQLLRLLQSDRN